MKSAFFFLVFWSVLAQSPLIMAQGNTATTGKAKVTVYYFHPAQRCPIDQSIEENTKDLIKKEYENEIKAGALKLQVLNTDDKANAKIVAQFDINTQALYIVKLDKGKEIKTDLTRFAFEFGLSNPSKFRNGLADEIDKALQ